MDYYESMFYVYVLKRERQLKSGKANMALRERLKLERWRVDKKEKTCHNKNLTLSEPWN